MTVVRALIPALVLGLTPACGDDDGGGSAGDDGGQVGGDGQEGEGEGAEGEGEGEGQEGEGEPAEGEGEAVRPDRPVSPWVPVVGLSGKVVTALTVVATKPPRVWAATRRQGLWRADLDIDAEFERVETPDDDIADVHVGPDGVTILLEDDGPWRSADGGETWTPLVDGWEVPDLPIDVAPSRPLARKLVEADGALFAAALGGVFKLEGESWSNVSLTGGLLNPVVETLFEDDDGTLYAGVADLSSFVPPEMASTLRSTCYRSGDGGATWQSYDSGLVGGQVTAFAADGGDLFAGTNGGGVFRLDRDSDAWEALDVADPGIFGLWSIPGGGLMLSGASGWIQVSVDRGEHWWDATGSLQAFPVPISAAFVPNDDANAHALVGLAGEGVFASPDVVGAPRAQRSDRPTVDDGEVHIALSFHVNLYHSYRGDSNDEDGFGKDIRVIRSILDMLDEYPEVRADWDIDNAFSLDDLLPTHAPDVVERIRDRVTGQGRPRDGLRIMSWNNGMAGAQTDTELRESLLRAKESYSGVFGNVLDPGLQPQENMFSPDQLDVLTQEDLGIEWLSLFYSATNFTGFRRDVLLSVEQAHNVLQLEASGADEGDPSLKLIPVYHHADVVDHGGMVAWAKQLHETLPETDALIAVHFDADAESWLGFANELRELKDADLPFVKYTTLQEYYRRHSARPAGDVVLARDLADGVHDGYGSWAEKWINREVWTPIERSRMKDQAAYELLRKVDRADRGPVNEARDAALTARLKALSTTHFGLANPALHPDRERSALALAAAAEDAAGAALRLATDRVAADQRPPAGDLWLFHPGDDPYDGVARVDVEFAEGEHLPDKLTARLHRSDDEDALGSRVPGQLVRHTEHADGSVATGEFWLQAELTSGELAGLSFETPARAPEFGDELGTERFRLYNEDHAEIRFGQDGAPFQAWVYLDDETYIPIGSQGGQGPWWQPWITWEGRRYAPERYEIDDVDDGWRGYTAAKRLTGSVDVPGGGTWEVAYTFRVVKDQRLIFLDVETTYPGDAGAPDPRLTEAVPVGLFPWIFDRELIDHDGDEDTPEVWNRDWIERHVVWRETYRDNWSGFPVQELRDSINSAAAKGWGAVFTTLVAFDRWERSSPAFLPLRFQRGQGLDLRVLLAPFGTLDGDPPDPRPERTRGFGVGARLTRMASHQGPSAPSLAGRTERFGLALGPVPAILGGSLSGRPDADEVASARAWATRPLVLTPGDE